MSPNENLRYVSLSELQEHCDQETMNFWRGLEEQSWSCYEIFRRAIVEKKEEAWGMIIGLYQSQVTRWVHNHPKFREFHEDPDLFVSLVFEKFWKRHFSASEFARFPDVKSLLAYIKTCVGSVITDFWRVHQKDEDLSLDDISHQQDQNLSYDDKVEKRLEQEEFWNKIRVHLDDDLAFEVIYYSFVLNLKPADIYSMAPTVYGTIQEVYRIKANALIRLEKLF